MTLRVPKAELPAELREAMSKHLGAVPVAAQVGYSAACEIPLAARPEMSDVASTA